MGCPIPFLERDQWFDFGLPKLTEEETPSLWPHEKAVEQDPTPTGNSGTCYICTRSLQNLQPNMVIRRDGEYKVDKTTRKYWMSYCVWCAYDWGF